MNKSDLNYKSLIARLDDLIDQAFRYNRQVSTNFLTGEEVVWAKNYLGKKYEYYIDGGYPGAESVKLYFNYKTSDIVCLRASFDTKFDSISHRDILGALMALSINRNQVGDFWVEANNIILYTTQTFSRFLIENFTSIKRSNIKFEVSTTNYKKIQNMEDFEDIISSNRLDNIVSVLTKLSRVKAQELILNKMVKVDHLVIAETSKLCNNDSMISIRGYGRFIYKGPVKTTKKNRLVVAFSRYI